jgi:gliding motility-associated-like protein
VTVSAGSCSSTDTVSVLSNTLVPDADAGAIQSLTCTASSVTLSGASATSGATFSWSGPGLTSGGTTTSPTVNAAGVYTITVTDPSNGCVATDTVSVLSNTALPDANAGAPQVLTCTASTVNLAGSSITGGATFSWSGAGITSGGATATPTVNASGTYTVTVTDPANGCTATATTSVTTNTTPPDANAGATQVLTCTAPAVNLAGSSVTSGATYSWSGPGIASGGATATPSVNAAGTYTVTVTDPANGCTATSTVAVTSNITVPDANAGTAGSLTCVTTSLNLNGSSVTPGATFSWSGGSVVSGGSTATPTVNAAGTYTVTVTDPSNGCTATASVIVSSNTMPPVADAGSVQSIGCGQLTATLDGSGSSSGAGISYNWTTVGGNIVSGGTTNAPVVDQGGLYTVTVTNAANGCTSTDTVSVLNVPSPVASFTATPGSGVAPLNVSFTNLSTNANGYIWDFGDGNGSIITSPSDIYTGSGTYLVTLIASFNGQCPDTTMMTIEVFDSLEVFIPNIFTPNGDGNNEIFKVTAQGIKDFKAQIFDRWGLKLYEYTDVSSGWDGHTASGTIVSDGTYYYIIYVKGQDGSEKTFKGYIQVLRR